jgi:nitrogen-specific signal transduction histidine kinase
MRGCAEGNSEKMSAAASPALLLETRPYLETRNLEPTAKEAIGDLAHELRQPLSSIEAIAYYLEMTLPADQCQARQYMRRVQQLVDQAESILGRAVSTARKPPASAPTAGIV